MPEKRKPHQVVVMDKDGKQLTPMRKNKERKFTKRAKSERDAVPDNYLVLYHNVRLLPSLTIEIKIMAVSQTSSFPR